MEMRGGKFWRELHASLEARRGDEKSRKNPKKFKYQISKFHPPDEKSPFKSPSNFFAGKGGSNQPNQPTHGFLSVRIPQHLGRG